MKVVVVYHLGDICPQLASLGWTNGPNKPVPLVLYTRRLAIGRFVARLVSLRHNHNIRLTKHKSNVWL